MQALKSILSSLDCFSRTPREIDVNQFAKFRSPTSSLSRDTFTKTSIVVAHGAFQTTWHYRAFADAVQKSINVDRVVVPQQSSSGFSPPPDSFHADVKLLHRAISHELRHGHDVLLVCHSYGGIPGCEALTDLPQHREGEVGKILGIVFVSAFVAEAGQSLVTSKMAGRAGWVRTEGALSHVNGPVDTIYNAVSPSSLASALAARLVPQASASFTAVTTSANWKFYPCYYIRCLYDRAMLVPEQNYFIARLQQHYRQGKKPQHKTHKQRRSATPTTTTMMTARNIRDLPSDHAPFASMPGRLAELVEGIVGELCTREKRWTV